MTELVTNAVVHGGGALRIEIARRDRCVRIRFDDVPAAAQERSRRCHGRAAISAALGEE